MADVNLSISSENKNSSLKMQGVSMKGDPGYTPQKGTDYFTQDDIEEISSKVEQRVTKEKLGLENVDNTSDLDKPVSNAARAEIDEISALLSNVKDTVEKLDCKKGYNDEIDTYTDPGWYWIIDETHNEFYGGYDTYQLFVYKADTSSAMGTMSIPIDDLVQYKVSASGIAYRVRTRSSSLYNTTYSWSDWMSVGGLAYKATTLNGYGITDAYTKTEVDTKDSTLKADISDLKQKSIPHTTASGYQLTVTDHLEGEEVINYQVYGNSVQSAEPSVETPVEIQSVGDLITDESSEYYGKYDIPITVRGKNWFDRTWYKTASEYTALDGVTAYRGMTIQLTPNTKYTVSFRRYDWDGLGHGRLMVRAFHTGDNAVIYIAHNTNPASESATHTYTTGDDGLLYIAAFSSDVPSQSDLDFIWEHCDIQIEEGSTATSFEPYTCETKHIYLNEPLRKVGDYADYIDWKNQKVVRQIEVLDDTGTKTIDESLGILVASTEEPIAVPELSVPSSEIMNVSTDTATPPSKIDLTYYRDINKVITNLTNAILAQGGNV